MNSWQNEFKEAIKTTRDLNLFLGEEIISTNFPIFLPRNFLQKIKSAGKNSPLWNQFIPNEKENSSTGLIDPIGDQKFQVTKNLIHRYKNRALFIPTINCPVSCRYCFRKNELFENSPFKSDIEGTLNYLKNHPEINEIIFTGGDPLVLSNDKFLTYAKLFSEIKSIKILRIHTRTPTILPSRIDSEFIEILKELKKDFTQVAMMIHTNHKSELDHEVKESISKIKATGIHLFSQTVLLKNINDNAKDLIELFYELGSVGIIPYYLHHPDRAYGTDHFQLELEKGRAIYLELRNNLPGWLIPQYIIDIPGGHGKVSAFNPESIKFNGELLDIHGEMIKI